MQVVIQTMTGETPRFKPFLLPENASTSAIDCHFENGIISPLRTDKSIITLPTAPQTLFYYAQAYFLTFSGDVSVIESPIGQDPYGRVYWTGDGKPKVSSNDVITNGSGNYPSASYTLGVPAPTSPPIVISNNPLTGEEPSEGELDSYDDEDRIYLQTYVTRFGEESAPSPVSPSVLVTKPGSTLIISLPNNNSNTSNIDRKRLYRSVTSDGEGDYMLVAELSYAQTSYVDSARDINSAIVETWDYSVPDENMQGLCLMANGICAGFVGNELMFSVAYLPYAWPLEYRLTVEHSIVALMAIETSLVVLTTGFPYLASGVSPGSIAAQKIPVGQSCYSKKSAVILQGAVIYASPDGLIGISAAGQVSFLTDQLITRAQWQLLKPETIEAFVYENKYIAQYDGGGFIYDPIAQSFSHLTGTWDCAYTDLQTDTTYIAQGAEVSAFQDGEEFKPMSWQSKVFIIDRGGILSACRVKASHPENVEIEFYADGQLVHTVTLGNLTDDAFRLPALRATKWQFKISGESEIEQILLSSSLSELI